MKVPLIRNLTEIFLIETFEENAWTETNWDQIDVPVTVVSTKIKGWLLASNCLIGRPEGNIARLTGKLGQYDDMGYGQVDKQIVDSTEGL